MASEITLLCESLKDPRSSERFRALNKLKNNWLEVPENFNLLHCN
jgi:hypothetical protein